MIRVLMLVTLIGLLYFIIKRLIQSAANPQKPASPGAEKMVQCAACGVHVPESESRLVNAKICCQNPDCQ